jgi:hypothetical protein
MLSSSELDLRFERLRAEALTLAADGPLTTPDAAPQREYRRTPAAARVAALAARDGLFCFHFEHRIEPALPEDWVPPGDPSLAEPPEWSNGVLPERKYQSFRHDLALGSFHPHHRAKWSTHELCHGLVGFAWHPTATAFFHATAGRLAELLPVALWYFFDEAFLTRCPLHQGDGALYRAHCPDCEAAARPLPDDPDAREHLRGGLRFLDRELAAIARSRREGRPLPHRHATLDLSADGVAYALAHERRLASPAFARFAEQFTLPQGGRSETLDALEARVLAVADALIGGPPPAALCPSPTHGRWRWIAQDLGWRLHALAHETDGEAEAALHDQLDSLAALVAATADPALPADVLDPRARATVQRTAEAYRALAEDWELPDPEELLALGYTAPGLATGWPQLLTGLHTCTPLTAEALGAVFEAEVQSFAAVDPMERSPLARRWARHLHATRPGPLADLAAWEAALSAVPPSRPPCLDGPGEDLALAPGLELLRFDHDVVRLAERVDEGAVDGDGAGGLIVLEGEPIEAAPTWIVLGRDLHDELLILDLDAETAEALGGQSADLIDPEVRAVLLDLHVLTPRRLAEAAPRTVAT